ncbi:NnrU family protein [Rhizobium paknamense]|uniref:Membrane protein n=1 Tax=Rhizobium paknamense TaxID=1206817 RepID=A0ABU0I872_9HYPH|nr:NnrU family protein [Rhizobium paknamense]MDQ0454436.1 putative membrane protein [Rhizobium paknamense]
MILFLIGLVLFLGFHSLRIFAPAHREQMVSRFGEQGFKIIYSVLSVLTLVLLIFGYAHAPVINVWFPPAGMNHLTITLMLFASICLFASLIPAGHIAVKTKHPLVLSVKIWAFAHLFSNGDLVSILLFVGFLAWGVVMRISLKRRERAGLPVLRPFVAGRYDLYALLLGIVFWAAMIFKLHELLIGVAPLPM